MWHGPNGEVSPMPPRITVDDLLAWLRCDAYFLAELMHHQDAWHIKFINTDSGLDGWWHKGPTLLAALESAVRAVAGES